MSDDFDNEGPGTAAYSPALASQDGVLLYRTRSSHKLAANAVRMAEIGIPVPGELMPPDPSMGGEMGQPNQLGWSDGFGVFRTLGSFTGRVVTRPTMGAHPNVGEVGFSTRTSRLRSRIEALYTDYTPSNQAVAREIVDGKGAQ